MSRVAPRTDGSAAADAHDVVRIDFSNPVERYRYTCPRGHIDVHPTNNHLWCKGCRRQYEAGEDVDPEWYEPLDKKTGERVPWSSVEVIE